MIEEALDQARKADVIVAVVGESAEMTGGFKPFFFRHTTSPEGPAHGFEKTGKPIVVVLLTGRPLTISWEHDNMDAILNVVPR